MASLITLLTDFGTSDTFVGQMKGMIARIAPEAQVVDLSHEVPAQDIAAAAILLADAVDAFPDNTVHVAVVDPGVGTERAALAVDLGRFKFVGPDNGLITPLLDSGAVRYAAKLDPARLKPKRRSHTFHGRDVFAPAAAYLARGDRPTDLGEHVRTIVTLDLPQPDITDERVVAHVLLIDHFGNLITDLREDALLPWGEKDAPLQIDAAGTPIGGLRRTFADVAESEPVAYIGSSGRLEVAVRNGHAGRVLGLKRGDAIEIRRV
jgi:hypothetical protein